MCGMCQLVLEKDDCALSEPDVSTDTLADTPQPSGWRTITETTDAPNVANDDYVMEVGDTFVGELDVVGDWDWIQINLEEGQTIQVTMNGAINGGVEDTYVSLWGPTGDGGNNYVAANDDFNGDIDVSQFVFQATTAGTYYIVADSYQALYDGNYTIDVVEVDPPSPLDAIEQLTALEDTSINVWFADAGYTTTVFGQNFTAEAWNNYEIGQFELAFDLIEAVTNVSFNIVGSEAQADFTYIMDLNQFGAYGAHEFPNNDGGQIAVYGGDTWDRTEGGDLEQGGFGFVTIVHEVLHGLGLAHPHDDGGGTLVMNGVSGAFGSLGSFDLNQGIFSTMSYNTGWDSQNGTAQEGQTYGVEAGPMAFDIAALQALYGASTHNNTNTTYVLPSLNATGAFYSAIWDSGGIDEIVHSGSTGAVIDLREATLEYEEGGGGFVSYVNGIEGGFTIAAGAVIENAVGGTGDDLITGNDVANSIAGARGDDTIYGGLGEDTIKGGNGNDTLYGGDGGDDLAGGQDDDILYGGDGINKLVGQSGSDTLYGGDDRDILNGGGDSDTLWGFDGNDRVKGGGSGDILYGGDGPDKLYGNNGADSLYGGDGDDLLNAGGLDDYLDGGTGDDRIKGGSGADDFVFNPDFDRDVIVDFNAAEGDQLFIDTSFWANGETAEQLVADHASVVGGDRVDIDLGNGNIIVLQGLTTTDGLAAAIEELI